jgi:hypothetical protein
VCCFTTGSKRWIAIVFFLFLFGCAVNGEQLWSHRWCACN